MGQGWFKPTNPGLVPSVCEALTGVDLGTAEAVRRRLLLTAEGAALRRLCHEVDGFEASELQMEGH